MMSEFEGVSIQSSGVFLTPDGHDRLQKELEFLTVTKRQEIASRIRESKEHGEFSEDNNELDEVKFEQAIVEDRIANLKAMFANAQVIDADHLNEEVANVGNYVEVKDTNNGMKFEIRLVCSVEADVDRDYVSNESPMGAAILGSQVGEVVVFEAPAGKISYEICKIRK
jgi:transcription elongation factor GreA